MPGEAERLETRLRAALGTDLPSYGAGDAAHARANVLAGIRRRRRRRLQVAGGGLAAALGVVGALSIAVGRGPGTTPKHQYAAGPSRAQNRQPLPAGANATCHVSGRAPVTPCGLVGSALVFGAAPSATPSPMAGRASPAAGTAGHPLVLRVGQEATVELPRTSGRHPWGVLRPVLDPLPNRLPTVTVRPTDQAGAWRIVAGHVGSTTVRAERPACANHAVTCSVAASAWSLYVEVTS